MKKKVSARQERRARIKQHIRRTLHGTADRPRMTVYRSLKGIQVQLVDDDAHHTLLTVSSQSKAIAGEVKKAKGKVAAAKIVGRTIAEEAKKKKIESVVFDRNGFLYHGRVKALADAAREAGIKF